MRIFILVFLAMFLAGPAGADNNISSLGTFKITHYCACKKCCGPKAQGLTASGKKVSVGMVACNWLPFGTKLKIDGKIYTVEDRGAKSIFGTKKNPKYVIDVYCASHSEARNKGVYFTNVEVLK